MLLLEVHALVTCALAGLCWAVQVLIYPAFRVVGPTPSWPAYHAAHSRRIAALLALPWAAQGVTLVGLLLREGLTPLLLVTSGAALLTVVVTVAVAVPLHNTLVPYDDHRAVRLLRANAWRTAAWSVGAVCSVLLLSGA